MKTVKVLAIAFLGIFLAFAQNAKVEAAPFSASMTIVGPATVSGTGPDFASIVKPSTGSPDVVVTMDTTGAITAGTTSQFGATTVGSMAIAPTVPGTTAITVTVVNGTCSDGGISFVPALDNTGLTTVGAADSQGIGGTVTVTDAATGSGATPTCAFDITASF